jgi:hypothetical protein
MIRQELTIFIAKPEIQKGRLRFFISSHNQMGKVL